MDGGEPNNDFKSNGMENTANLHSKGSSLFVVSILTDSRNYSPITMKTMK